MNDIQQSIAFVCLSVRLRDYRQVIK